MRSNEGVVACKPGLQASAIRKASLHADHPPMCHERTLSRQGRKKTNQNLLRTTTRLSKNDPRDWPAIQTTENKARTDLPGKNDPENPRTSTLTTLDDGRKSRGTTDAPSSKTRRGLSFLRKHNPPNHKKHNG